MSTNNNDTPLYPHATTGAPALNVDVQSLLQELHAVVPLIKRLHASFEELKERLNGSLKSHFTVAEVAEMTGRAPYTVRHWINERRINAERIAGTGPKGKLLIPRDELAKLVRCGVGGLPAVVAGD